jgi:hypothetical protein
VRECIVLLENLFLIRIGMRDPGPHILAKQRLVGAGNEPFAFSGFRAMAAVTHFLVATVCFLSFRSPLSMESFILFGNFFTEKTNS